MMSWEMIAFYEFKYWATASSCDFTAFDVEETQTGSESERPLTSEGDGDALDGSDIRRNIDHLVTVYSFICAKALLEALMMEMSSSERMWKSFVKYEQSRDVRRADVRKLLNGLASGFWLPINGEEMWDGSGSLKATAVHFPQAWFESFSEDVPFPSLPCVSLFSDVCGRLWGAGCDPELNPFSSVRPLTGSVLRTDCGRADGGAVDVKCEFIWTGSSFSRWNHCVYSLAVAGLQIFTKSFSAEIFGIFTVKNSIILLQIWDY